MIGSLDGPPDEAWPEARPPMVRRAAKPEGECDPALVFELADEALEPGEARLAKRHLESCGNCRTLYEHERDLSARLGAPLRSTAFAPPASSSGRCSVHQAVAMALPTRHPLVRLLWAGLAGALLLSAVVLIGRDGAGAFMPAIGALAAFWGMAWGGVEVARAVLAAVGPGLLLILALGALVDLLVASCAVLLVRRARAHRRPGRT